ncbi:MAG TPA: hypothetical protein VF553_11465 [Pyrinomonadaceae bacterium]|jgi:hypothetical protein
MQTTYTPLGLHWPIAEQPVDARLNWLLRVNAAERARLARAGLEEEMMMMRHPLSVERAYSLFGLLLGALPPAAIFYRLFGREVMRPDFQLGWFLLLLAMNVACCWAGRFMACRLSGMAGAVERGPWLRMLLMPLVIGLLWGASAGALGGFIFYGIGSFFGPLFAVPVGLLAFALFMPLHRLLAHGGMIEASHLWPLACGVALTITALILGL